MKKLSIILFALFFPIFCSAGTVDISFYSDDPNLDAYATLSYRLCTNIPHQKACSVSEMKHLNFYVVGGDENKAQITGLASNQFVIGWQLSVGNKKPPYINSPDDLDQPCKAANGEMLVIQPHTDGIYACNNELSHL